jgi:hypothetical protein
MDLPIAPGQLGTFKIPDIGHKRLQKSVGCHVQPLEKLSLNFQAASYPE